MRAVQFDCIEAELFGTGRRAAECRNRIGNLRVAHRRPIFDGVASHA